MTTQTHCLTCGGSKRLPNPSWWRSKKWGLVRPCPDCISSEPSPIVLALAATWEAGSPLLVGQVSALTRWVTAACAELPEAKRAPAVAIALGIRHGSALGLCIVAGVLP